MSEDIKEIKAVVLKTIEIDKWFHKYQNLFNVLIKRVHFEPNEKLISTRQNQLLKKLILYWTKTRKSWAMAAHILFNQHFPHFPCCF